MDFPRIQVGPRVTAGNDARGSQPFPPPKAQRLLTFAHSLNLAVLVCLLCLTCIIYYTLLNALEKLQRMSISLQSQYSVGSWHQVMPRDNQVLHPQLLPPVYKKAMITPQAALFYLALISMSTYQTMPHTPQTLPTILASPF
jgi:hypothetical protein